MRLKMSENSLFAVLLRSPWWISFAIAVALALTARYVLPDQMAPYSPFMAFPFVVTGLMSAWKQLKRPSAARVSSTLEAVGAMSWREFSALMEAAFQRDGYAVTRVSGIADFSLAKAGRTSLVGCKRWKAASLGIEPLRELHAVLAEHEATEAIYVAAGAVTENARRFAADHGITLMQGPELARLLGSIARAPKAAA